MPKLLLPTLTLSLLLASLLSAAPKPNVLFISIDDLNDWAGVFKGHPQTKTPHLDNFAANGAMVFQNARCPGPVCCISRSSLLSGFWPSTTGVYGNSQNMLDSTIIQENATLPEYFSKHGYHSLSRGKIFHKHATENGSDSGHWAFDHWEKTQGGSPVDPDKVTSRNKNLINGKPAPPSDHTGDFGTEFAWGPTRDGIEKTKDYQTAQWAAAQLQEPHEKPFFMAVGISRPHLPFYAPQEFFDLYDPETFKANEIREDDLDDILSPKTGKPKHGFSTDYRWLKENDLIDDAARAYAAACSYADTCLGVIFDALEQSPYNDNTIVVIWGDHGWHLGEKMKYRKGTAWNESTRVPLIVRLPEMTDQQDCLRPVNLIDLFPTLVELCNLPEKPTLEGRDFSPLLTDPQQPWDYPSVTVTGEGSATAIDERFHYIRYSDGVEEFYDLETDPMEFTNLINEMNPEWEPIKEKLAAALPKSFAPGIPKTDPSFKKTAKTLDQSIKPARPLSKLK